MSKEELEDKLKNDIRRDAMAWWNDLSAEKKLQYVTRYHSGRSSNSLTGREIEVIYRDIHGLPKFSE